MGEVSSRYGGLTDQLYCNVHPYEKAAIDYWRQITVFTPERYELRVIWRTWWAVNTDSSDERRAAFEREYGLEDDQTIIPPLVDPVDIIRSTNLQYFFWLEAWLNEGTETCASKKYPTW